MNEILKQSQVQQEALDEVQKTLRRLSFDGQDEQGTVQVRVSGDGRIRSVTLDPSLKDKPLEDLAVAILEAANEALSKARTGSIERLSARGAELAGAGDLLLRQDS